MTEYGRGPEPQPWHPEDPLYGNQNWDGAAQQGAWDAYGGHQQQYPRQEDPYGGWHDPQAATGSYPQPTADPYGAQAGYPQHGAYPAPPQHGYAPHPQQGPEPYAGAPQPGGGQPGGPYHPGPQHHGGTPYPADHQHQHQPYPGQYDGHAPALQYPGPDQPRMDAGQAPDPGWNPDWETGAGAGREDSHLTHASHSAVADPGPPESAAPRRGDGRPGRRRPEPEDDDGYDADDADDADNHEPATRADRRGAARRRSGRRKNRMACLVVVLVLAGGAAAATYAGYSFYQSRFAAAPDYPGAGSGEVTVEIPPGSLPPDMAEILAEADVVKSAAAFVEAANANQEKARSIQPGIYTLREKMSAAQAFELLLDPASQAGMIVPEGLRASRIYALIDEHTGSPEGTTEKVAETADLDLPAWAEGNVEGFLFPSKYAVSENTEPLDVLGEMVERAKSEFARVDLEGQAAEVDRTPYEILIIASLVQAEAQEKKDFGKVSRVVYNRLKPGNTATNGKLDFDSTINYALDRSTLDVSVKDTGLDHPYNTYKNVGLPPGPIDNPGHQAIEAALNPTEGPWLYFVTVKPGDTRFSETYEEHQAHVKDFNAEQARKREEEGE
ncbi:endolytic transglycosylase MltG [Streptomyces sp. JJ38]|uniref:endolytic transglycosylase MltG n=1 Tax=Streptomyces sp. JJ38 TaxID=2738128 RepID=UPI001C573068|nr:endolytic transglycosylase MltG [Streptomyces sp. JJ38]MBW1596754.1 endolytic transglycosylase MltG [Streptomyces sp. JJ38]